ncbi:hypothetical protein CBW65_11300 [Tumebacillus avium]|uniref:AAA+ ATPase domain-containing protein n=1 Tax=Tumebacillus avium TaxID=1903704 RepID=A0A1Y0IMQ3_9BACL|nr:AAA family ATPase [Tumebacillus avium]ARU61530.1 hypothetical protein CBW65_11300 [Tumebacillus avium]
MKIRKVSISNFKGIEQLEVPFVNEYEEIRKVTTIFGDNGSGKTTVLQAIALVISMATRKTWSADQFQWHGFLPGRMSSLGKTKIVVEIEFDDREIESVHKLFSIWRQGLPDEEKRRLVEPGHEKRVTLVYEDGDVRAEEGLSAKMQFLGRCYIKSLLSRDPHFRDLFHGVGDVFWFDQYRNLASGSQTAKDAQTTSWAAGAGALRMYLVGWWFHRSVLGNKAKLDYIEWLEGQFSKIFSGTRFEGPEAMHELASDLEDYYFLLSRQNKKYDVSEMSSGEQAIFCVLYEFIRQQIAHSIVLIDELELHLHPPEQQALFLALNKMGDDCQYIITSHSTYLQNLIPDEDMYRIQGGKLCL